MADWKDVLSKIAPTAATILAGPFAGLATQLVGEALGLPNATTQNIQQAITNSQLSGDQILALKKAETDLQVHLQDNGIELERIAASDRASARNMAVSTQSKVPAILSFLIIILAACGEGGLLIGYEPHIAPELVGRVLGTLDAAVVIVLNYWFGTTAGSNRKTELMAQQFNLS